MNASTLKGTKDGPQPCQLQDDGYCPLCKLEPLPGLCHQPGPLDLLPEEAMLAGGFPEKD